MAESLAYRFGAFMSSDPENSDIRWVIEAEMSEEIEREEAQRERAIREIIRTGDEHAAAKKIADDIERQQRIEKLAHQMLLDRGIVQAPSPGSSIPHTIPISAAITEYEQTALDASTNISKSKRMAMAVLRQLEKGVGSGFDMSGLTDDVVEDKWMTPRLRDVSASTVKRDLSFIRGFVEWASNRKRKYCPAKLSLSVTVTETEKRSTFTSDDLTRMFGALPDSANKAWHLWLPLIGLYTGARIGEIASLNVDHIYMKYDVNAIHIPGTKTALSKRDIPIHPDLINIGLLDYAKARKRAGYNMLFDIPASATNGAGGEAARWFGRYLDKLKISDDQRFSTASGTQLLTI